MTIYRKKRLNYGLSLDQMARYMELPYNIYKKLDDGVNLEGEEKMFEKIIRKIGIQKIEELNSEVATNIKLDESHKMLDVNEFYENFDKDEMFKKFNIISYYHLSTLLEGNYSPQTIATYLSYKNRAKEKFRKVIYDFFSDGKNIQDPKEAVKCVKNGYKVIESQLDENQMWFNKNFDTMKLDIANLVNDGQVMGSQLKFCKKYGLNNTCLSKMLNRKMDITSQYAKVLRNALEPKVEQKTFSQKELEGVIENRIIRQNKSFVETDFVTPTLYNDIYKETSRTLEEIETLKEEKESLNKIIDVLREENKKLKEMIAILPREVLVEMLLNK